MYVTQNKRLDLYKFDGLTRSLEIDFLKLSISNYPPQKSFLVVFANKVAVVRHPVCQKL